jgi:PKD repeat protein
MTIALTAAPVAVAITIILFSANVPIANAQQQQQPPLSSQPTVTQNGTTTLFQSIEDGVKLKVPQGWVIHDVNNTGFILEAEERQGYGILAQLCPEKEEEQQQGGAALSNASGGSGNTASCQGSEGGNVIHIVRYPDLDTRLQVSNNATTTTTNNNNNIMTIDNILLYHMQKLEEVGYNGIEIVNSTDTTLNVTNAQTNQVLAIVPAKNVEITYSTASAPNQTRIGYFILTATNATSPNVGTTTKGYSIFYEGNSDTTTAETTIPSGSLVPTPLPPPVRQVFDSFELVTAATPAAPSSSSATPATPATPAAAPPPTAPLAVEITSSDTEGGEVAPATFDFDADVTGGTEPYTYSWDFDGESIEEIDDDETEHTFEDAGTYNVGLTVTDSEGQSASDSMEITVEEAPAAEENNSGSDGVFGIDDLVEDLF